SAKEQATGLAEINTAVNGMDQVTQQNAAMVEQSTAAAHALAREADELGSLVARFTLAERPAARPTSAKPALAKPTPAKPTPKPAAPAAAPPARPVAALKTLGQRAVAALRKPHPAPAEQDWEEF
ncbi:MAG: methyl-accepting chemotaxis protein, partial [Methylobacteriaceae bacterium]|nr:methyl-accepting chemotaxis protein [Methylobacteriaceae bacterium]